MSLRQVLQREQLRTGCARPCWRCGVWRVHRRNLLILLIQLIRPSEAEALGMLSDLRKHRRLASKFRGEYLADFPCLQRPGRDQRLGATLYAMKGHRGGPPITSARSIRSACMYAVASILETVMPSPCSMTRHTTLRAV